MFKPLITSTLLSYQDRVYTSRLDFTRSKMWAQLFYRAITSTISCFSFSAQKTSTSGLIVEGNYLIFWPCDFSHSIGTRHWRFTLFPRSTWSSTTLTMTPSRKSVEIMTCLCQRHDLETKKFKAKTSIINLNKTEIKVRKTRSMILLLIKSLTRRTKLKIQLRGRVLPHMSKVDKRNHKATPSKTRSKETYSLKMTLMSLFRVVANQSWSDSDQIQMQVKMSK